jgi:hypothetical protein
LRRVRSGLRRVLSAVAPGLRRGPRVRGRRGRVRRGRSPTARGHREKPRSGQLLSRAGWLTWRCRSPASGAKSEAGHEVASRSINGRTQWCGRTVNGLRISKMVAGACIEQEARCAAFDSVRAGVAPRSIGSRPRVARCSGVVARRSKRVLPGRKCDRGVIDGQG